jgi:hypothetical protein
MRPAWKRMLAEFLGRISERNVLFGRPREEGIIKVDCN